MSDVERHVPVLLQQAIRYLNVRPGGVYVDATLGFAGHASAVARLVGAGGRLICFDRDPEAMALAKARLAEVARELGPAMPELVFHDVEFSQAAEFLAPASVDGLLADFGASSMHFDQAQRGFS